MLCPLIWRNIVIKSQQLKSYGPLERSGRVCCRDCANMQRMPRWLCSCFVIFSAASSLRVDLDVTPTSRAIHGVEHLVLVTARAACTGESCVIKYVARVAARLHTVKHAVTFVDIILKTQVFVITTWWWQWHFCFMTVTVEWKEKIHEEGKKG